MLIKLEQFVVEKISAIGKDPTLITETIAAAKRAKEERKPQIESELRHFAQEKSRLLTERQNLLDAIAQGGNGTSSLTERLGETEEAFTKLLTTEDVLHDEVLAIENGCIDEQDLREALSRFDPLWQQLKPSERRRVLWLLIESVTFDGPAGEVEITFRAGGINHLAGGEAS